MHHSQLNILVLFCNGIFLCLFDKHKCIKVWISTIRNFKNLTSSGCNVVQLCLSLYREMVSSQRKSVILLQDQGQGSVLAFLYFDIMCC